MSASSLPLSPMKRQGQLVRSAWPFLVLALGYAALVGYGIWVSRIPAIAVGGLLLLSLLTFFVYGFDKHAAETGRWRTQESTLHLLALIGGWPGPGARSACSATRCARRAS